MTPHGADRLSALADWPFGTGAVIQGGKALASDPATGASGKSKIFRIRNRLVEI
jgi:hypothetical protein